VCRIILGEKGGGDTVIVDYRYMDKTFPVKQDGMVDIDAKEFDERSDPTNVHYGADDVRAPGWRTIQDNGPESGPLTYSRLVCCELIRFCVPLHSVCLCF
jgi:hypothetical protein